MIQETAPAAVERGEATSASSLLEPPTLVEQEAGPRISRLALAALWLGIGTFLALVLVGLDGWLMSQGVLDTHDLASDGDLGAAPAHSAHTGAGLTG